MLHEQSVPPSPARLFEHDTQSDCTPAYILPAPRPKDAAADADPAAAAAAAANYRLTCSSP
jgi:hypothetical protein